MAFYPLLKWLSKNQNQSNYSDQSQQEKQLNKPITIPSNYLETCSKRGKSHTHMVRLVLVLLLIGWKTGASLLSQSLSAAIAIMQLLSTVIWKLLYEMNHIKPTDMKSSNAVILQLWMQF